MNIDLNAICRAGFEKEPTPLLVCIDIQSIKLAPFVSEERGVDGNKKINGRKRQVMVDCIHWDWFGAVSYTHLDVYKRQG